MKKLILGIIAAMLLFAPTSWATDAMTVLPIDYKGYNLRIIKIDWTDSPALTMESQYSGIDSWIQGWYLFKVQTVPGLGADQPDDDYDIDITDAEGCDVMGAELENRDETNAEEAVPKIDAIYAAQPSISSWTITVTGQTDTTATGEIYLFFAKYQHQTNY
jgi:hypothetical protein